MHTVTCPRCHDLYDEYPLYAADGPPEYPPCFLCDSTGRVEDGVADLYLAGLWRKASCEFCGRDVIVVETANAELCAPCAAIVADVPF